MKSIFKIMAILLLSFGLVGCGKGKLSEEEISSLIVESGIEVGDSMLAIQIPIDEVIDFEIIERNTDKKNGYDEMRAKLKAYSNEVTIDSTVRVNLTYDIETWRISRVRATENNTSVSIDKDLTEKITDMYSKNETIKEIKVSDQIKNYDEDGSVSAKVVITGELEHLDATYKHVLNFTATPKLSVSAWGGLNVNYDVKEESPIEVNIKKANDIKNTIVEDYKTSTRIQFPNQYFSWYSISDDKEKGNSFKINETGDITFKGSESYGEKKYDEISVSAIMPIDFTITANKDSNSKEEFQGYLHYKYSISEKQWQYFKLSDEL